MWAVRALDRRLVHWQSTHCSVIVVWDVERDQESRVMTGTEMIVEQLISRRRSGMLVLLWTLDVHLQLRCSSGLVDSLLLLK